VTGGGIAKDRLHLEFITIHFEARTGRLTALGAWQVSDVEQGGASAKRWERDTNDLRPEPAELQQPRAP
jgi:hypothetical protein